MATATSGSGNTSANNIFAGDPFCTRGLRDALERLEQQIGRIGEIASEKDVVSSNESCEVDASPPEILAVMECQPECMAPSVNETISTAAEGLHVATPQSRDEGDLQLAQLRAELNAEIEQSNARRAAAEQRAQSLQDQALAAAARADELAQQVELLQKELQARQSVPVPAPAPEPAPNAEADLQKQVAALQSELRVIRKERDQLMTRLEREQSRLQKAGISIEWDKQPAKVKPSKTKRRSSG